MDERTGPDALADEHLGLEQGLSTREAAARLARYGSNTLTERRRSVVLEFLAKFWAPIPWMIEVALVLTALTGRWADFAVIGALLLLNGVVGFWEEHQAATAIDALRERLARRATVMRDGVWRTVPAADLVPGDLIVVERGNVVPADGLVVQGGAEVDESVLTGESLPVERGRGEGLFSGTIIARGAPRLRVLATGAATAFGRTAALAEERPPASHFQVAIFRIGRALVALSMALVVAIVIISLARGTSLAATLEFALVIVIASIPVALPAVLSVTMAVGARELARREAVVSHLPVVEEMSGVDVLCADKTGTITKNELAVAGVTPVDPAVTAHEVLSEAALTAEPQGSDPVDQAIRAALGSPPAELQVLELEPFDADRKRAVAHVADRDGARHQVAKGALQAILDLTGDADPAAEAMLRATEAFAVKGQRALAVARTQDGRWRPLGVLAIEDPPRDDSRRTLTRARRLGVKIKMVTGDRVEIAREIGDVVGIGSRMLDSAAIAELPDEPLADAVEKADGFAQVVPEDKYRIVRALQSRGHIVAMTGDGVNDAPALRRAEAGIAVSGATDAARAAADIVLLSPGLSVIVDAIRGARAVFRRMVNYAVYRITETIRVVVFVAVAIVAFDFFPVTPAQIVLLAMLNDAAILTIAYDHVESSPRPERWDLREVLTIATTLGLGGVVESLSLLSVATGPLGLGHAEAQTLMYLKLSVAGHLTLFVARTRGPLWSHPRPAPILLLAVIGTQAVATLIAAFGLLMPPLRPELLALAWIYAIAWIFLLDRLKLAAYRALGRHPPRARDQTSAA